MADKAVLVVGGAGYIGSHMVKELLGAGHHPVTLDNLSRGHRELVSGGDFVAGDIGDAALLDAVFDRYPIGTVMHFAAHSLVGESVSEPLMYYRNNVAATANLLAAMLRHGVRRFVFSSTAAVYGNPRTAPISEDHHCNPTNPYGASKLMVERMLADCADAYGLNFVALRYFNAAGADASGALGERHDPETHLIPLVLQVAAGQRRQIEIYGDDYPTPDGTCVRDYVHVSDLAKAHLLALEAIAGGRNRAIYNLGNCIGHSVQDVIRVARAVTARDIPAVLSARRPGDPATLIADSRKIRDELGWKPRYERIETIVETAWAWHQREISAPQRESR